MSVKFNYAQKDIIDNLYRSQSLLGDWNAAMQVTQTSLAVAKGSMGDAAMVGGVLGTRSTTSPTKPRRSIRRFNTSAT
jgi:hypothetical protein